jgi:acyl carrier protein
MGGQGLDMDAVETRISEIISEELELDPGELGSTGHFIDDYDGDSLSLITVLARIDRELGIRIPPAMQEELVNLDAVMRVIRTNGLAPGRV